MATLQKEKQVEELRTLLQQCPIKEVIAEVAKIEVPLVVTPAATPAIGKTKKTKKDLDTKMPSSKPSLFRRSVKKKMKEPSPESEEEEESTEETGSSRGDVESREEDKPATPLPKKKKRMDTRASTRRSLPQPSRPLSLQSD